MTGVEPPRPQPVPADLYAETLAALKEIASLAANAWGSDEGRDAALERINELALRACVRLQDQ